MSTNYPDNNKQNPVGNPYRWGFCDAVMNRPSECPWKGVKTFIQQSNYLKGYMAGQKTGVTFNG